jgi:hypothetical protein
MKYIKIETNFGHLIQKRKQFEMFFIAGFKFDIIKQEVAFVNLKYKLTNDQFNYVGPVILKRLLGEKGEEDVVVIIETFKLPESRLKKLIGLKSLHVKNDGLILFINTEAKNEI